MNYWRAVNKRACANTISILGLQWGSSLLVKTLLAGGAIIFSLFWGLADAARDEFWGRIASAVAIGLIFPAFYFWQLLSVPAKMDKEKQAAIDAFNKNEGPRLLLRFDPGDPGCIVTSPIMIGAAHGLWKWVRAKVLNDGNEVAQRCKVHLLSVERVAANGGALEATEFTDVQLLNFSNTGPIMNLQTDIPQFVDIVVSDNVSRKLKVASNVNPFRLNRLFENAGTYHLSLQVTDEVGRNSNRLEIDVTWNGNWEGLSASLSTSKPSA
jgi:hypothetical protein